MGNHKHTLGEVYDLTKDMNLKIGELHAHVLGPNGLLIRTDKLEGRCDDATKMRLEIVDPMKTDHIRVMNTLYGNPKAPENSDDKKGLEMVVEEQRAMQRNLIRTVAAFGTGVLGILATMWRDILKGLGFGG